MPPSLCSSAASSAQSRDVSLGPPTPFSTPYGSLGSPFLTPSHQPLVLPPSLHKGVSCSEVWAPAELDISQVLTPFSPWQKWRWEIMWNLLIPNHSPSPVLGE